MIKTKKERTLNSILPYLFIVLGIIGFICAFVIMFEKLKLLQNPAYQPSCSINPIISCGSVMSSKQGSVFGFPNPIIGLAAFPVVITIGMAMLAGANFKRWFWRGLEAGTIFGVIFIHWLAFESIYRIQALCPYCIIVWSVVIPLFFYTTMHNFREGHMPVPSRLKGACTFIQRHHGEILVLWYAVIAGLILHHFWYYWKTLL